MDPIIGGALINAGSSLLGNLLGGGTNNHAGRDQRQATSYAIRASVLDKVAAAKEAGVSPLYALGAPVISASSAVGSPSSGGSLGQTLSDMGHDVGRAVAAQQTAAERALQNLTLEKAGLENDYLRAQIASIRARTIQQSAPAIPLPHGPGSDPLALSDDVAKPTRTQHLDVGVPGIETNPYFSDFQNLENRYGDSEIAATLGWLVGPLMDAYWNLGGNRIARSGKLYYDRILPEGSYGRFNRN